MTRVDDYDYELPEGLIAQQPLARRADARLMLVDRQNQSITHHHIRDLPELLRAGDTLVLNNTRVLPARLVGYRQTTRGRWEGLFLAVDEQGAWRILAKARGKLEAGETIQLVDADGRDAFALRLVTKEGGGAWIARPCASTSQALPTPETADAMGQAVALLEAVGRVPLPHYIRGGQMVEADRQRYQTVYASQPGAAAAPTAGLHFTRELLEQIAARGIGRVEITLHVGIDTLRPIGVADLAEHAMHSEWAQIEAAAVEQLRQTRAAGGRIVAIGTTSTRVLETAARSGELQPWQGPTDLFIRPPYEFRAVDALVTNFHLPRSTLLVLVRTLGGDALMRRAYETAIAEEYRFYSYGDAMLIV
jgi:S-adenosylmethionine:tRNA ribosyltransferase-isomerase